jgi:hypothetical protein
MTATDIPAPGSKGQNGRFSLLTIPPALLPLQRQT